MYTVKVDPHTHTIASGHGFSTIEENARHAADRGLEAIGMADHYSPHFTPMRDGKFPQFGPMMNMPSLPKVIYGVRILASAEIDIIDLDGHLFTWDLTRPWGPNTGESVLDGVLKTRDFAIAGVHNFAGSNKATKAEGTRMYTNVLRTPGVHAISHPGRAGVPFDVKEVVRVAKETGAMLEINDHSFDFSDEVHSFCREIAITCAEMDAPVIVSSDAHSAFFVGVFDKALAMLDEIGFPQALIANESLEKLMAQVASIQK